MILRPSLPLFCLSLLILDAQEDLLPLGSKAIKESAREATDSLRNRIPAGAVLKNFAVPRFDENNRKTALLTAERMVVDSADLLEGENLKLWFYDENETIRSTASLEKGRFLIEKEQLIGDGNIIVQDKDDQFYAHSEGGIFDIATGQALMLGPTQTMLVVSSDKRISMKPKTLLPIATFVQLLVAAPPPELTAEELAAFEKTVAPTVVPESKGTELMAEADQVNAGLDRRLAEYFATIGKSELLLQVATPAPAESDAEAAFEKLFEPHPDRIFITSSKGFYYDGTHYELVYLGNIVLNGKGVRMTCNENIKVIFDPPPEKSEAEKKEDEKDSLSGLGKIGELKQLTATGKIRVSGEKDGKTFYLGGDRALFDQAKNQLIIRGNQLAMSIGGNATRTDDNDAYIVVDFNEDNTVKEINPSKGHWEISVDTRKNKK